MIEEMIAQKQSYVEDIHSSRKKIAELKTKKAEMKPPLWEEATGTVDAKKDYIRGKTADIDQQILIEEANIEYCYDMIAILNDKMVYCDE